MAAVHNDPRPPKAEPPAARANTRHKESEREVDATLAESFPASDPPSWVPLTGIRSSTD